MIMATNETESNDLYRPEYSPRSPDSLTDPSETCPKRLINEKLLAIKEEMSESLTASPICTQNFSQKDSTLFSQIPNQEFYLKLDKSLENLPRLLYIDELMLKCNNDSKLINWYRQTLADRARKFSDCPVTKLLTRRTTNKRNSAYKSAEDCCILQGFINGERSGEIFNVFCSTNGPNASVNDSVFLTPQQNITETCDNVQSLNDKITVPETMAMLTQIQRELCDLKRKREEDCAILNQIKQEITSMAITTKLMYATINSIRSSLPPDFFEETTSAQSVSKQQTSDPSQSSSEQLSNTPCISSAKPREVLISTPTNKDQSDRSYRDALITPNSEQTSVKVSSSTALPHTKVQTKKNKLLSSEQRSKAFAKPNQSNVTVECTQADTSTDDVVVIDDAICEIDVCPAVNTLQNDRPKGENSLKSNHRNTSRNVSKAVRAHDGVNDDDLFIGVSRKRVVSYYISNIDQSSTYSGFMKFLESKGVTATQVRLFYHKFSISAKLNIPSMYCYLVESEDFWPDRMKCRKWLEKNEWEKEQETRREEYERNRRERFERREREDSHYRKSYRESRHGDLEYYSGRAYDNDDDYDDDYDYRKDKNVSSKRNYDCFGRSNISHEDSNEHIIKYQYWNDY